MNKNSITKENLIRFIEINFDELSIGNCADYNGFEDKYLGMKIADINACEKILTSLITKKHNTNYIPLGYYDDLDIRLLAKKLCKKIKESPNNDINNDNDTYFNFITKRLKEIKQNKGLTINELENFCFQNFNKTMELIYDNFKKK